MDEYTTEADPETGADEDAEESVYEEGEKAAEVKQKIASILGAHQHRLAQTVPLNPAMRRRPRPRPQPPDETRSGLILREHSPHPPKPTALRKKGNTAPSELSTSTPPLPFASEARLKTKPPLPKAKSPRSSWARERSSSYLYLMRRLRWGCHIAAQALESGLSIGGLLTAPPSSSSGKSWKITEEKGDA